MAFRDRLRSGLSAQTVLVLTSVLVVAAASIYRLSADPNVISAGAMPPSTGTATVSTLALPSVVDAAALDSDGETLSVAVAPVAGSGDSASTAGSIQPGSREPSTDGRSTGALAGAADGDSGEPTPSPGRVDRFSAAGSAATASTATTTGSGTSGTSASTAKTTAPSSPPTTAVETTTTGPATTAETTTTTRLSTTVVTTSASTVYLGPAARDDSASAEPGKDVKIHVLRNDVDGADEIDKDTLVIISGPGHADSYRVHGDHLHYRSEDAFVGIDRLHYQVCDEAGRCDQASVAVTVG